MNPILYKSTETEFKSNGIGVLSDAISCIVTEKRNGAYNLQMRYPVDGIHYGEIEDRSIILAKPNPTDDAQPFRVYRSTKPMNGIVTFFADHISYDLLGIPVSPFVATDIADAFNKLKDNAVGECPFSFGTDKDTIATMSVRYPQPIRSLLAGQSGSVLDVYGGGEYKFDRFNVYLYQHRGTERGVSIRYGKNLLDLEQERNISNVYTGVYPYWTDMNGENLVQLPDKVVNAPGTYDYSKIKMLDLSSSYEEAPTVEQLQNRAESYIKNNNIGVPSVNLTVSHAMLENAEEYKGQELLERIDLCDTVSVEFSKLGVSATAKAVEVEYNVLLDRYESITFGNASSSFIQTAVDQLESEKKYTELARGLVGQAMEKLNEIVQNSSGLYTTEEEQPDGSMIYYFHDKPELKESKNVIKFTADAIGLSTDGGKSYPFGFTVTGDMVANILSAIGVNANWINAGSINLNLLKLAGTICGLMQGYGMTGEGLTTEGIVIYGNGLNDDGSAKMPYIIVTNKGIRCQISQNCNFNMAENSSLFVDGPDLVLGTQNNNNKGTLYCKDIYAKDALRFDSLNAIRNNSRQLWFGDTYATNVYLQGSPLYINETGLQTYARGGWEFADSVTVNGGISLGSTFQPAAGKNSMYLDWTAVRGVDGNQYWALCGYRSPN